ncbi:hypothetical protein SmphiM6_108 [Sinorhizobium phage phiM6]|nr:hypothetical protein SmphiM6_108 [Sinorhizobium phage phiM6]
MSSEVKLNSNGKPLYVRKGEQVGGGFFVMRRGSYAGRLKPSKLPYEHPDIDSARAEISRLRELHPEHNYTVLCEVSM